MRRFVSFRVLLVSFFVLLFALQVPADTLDEFYTNPATGYRAVLKDDAGLLEENEWFDELEDRMTALTAYGNVAFLSTDSNFFSSKSYVTNITKQIFGGQRACAFLIDLKQRELKLYSQNGMERVVHTSDANVIADNIYRYASNGEYTRCAALCFDQVLSLFRGEEIARPMKYISNLLLAFGLSVLINFMIVIHYSRTKKSGAGELKPLIRSQELENGRKIFRGRTRVRRHSSSDGGGGSGGGSGGGGGGGSSCGGHSF